MLGRQKLIKRLRRGIRTMPDPTFGYEDGSSIVADQNISLALTVEGLARSMPVSVIQRNQIKVSEHFFRHFCESVGTTLDNKSHVLHDFHNAKIVGFVNSRFGQALQKLLHHRLM